MKYNIVNKDLNKVLDELSQFELTFKRYLLERKYDYEVSVVNKGNKWICNIDINGEIELFKKTVNSSKVL